MIDGLKPYAEMKPSGLAWLGDVPAHWDILRAKRLLRPTQLPIRPDDEIVTCFRDGQVTLRKNRRAGGFMIALLEQGYQGVRVGQLVVHSMDAFAGAIGVSDSDGKCTPEYIVCKPRSEETIPGYYSWVLRQAARTGYILASCPAVRERAPRLRYPDLAELKVPVPPPEEQRLIVRFLDWHGAQTAKLIRAKKKIIALLNEQKQAIIHRAVTRGLDPNVRLKPSGAPWLGDVPEGWEVKRLGHVAELTPGFAFPSSGFTHDDEDVRLLRGINVSPGKVRWNSVVRWPAGAAHDFSKFSLQCGDIVVGMDRPVVRSGIRVARIELNDTPSLLLQRVVRLRFSPEIDETFGYFVLRGSRMIDYLLPIFSGISVPHISPQQLSQFRIALPDFDEQKSIVDSLGKATHNIDVALDRAESEVTALLEFRTRLIADVVTGKLDVRAFSATLPDVANDQPIEDAVEEDDLYVDEAGVEDQEEVAA